ncbi:NUDIX domain protein [Leptospira kirschneri serovar Mozdok]|nr:NUDIX domain protein [Leptospira kirschneri serovar Mozdok]
MKPFLPEEYDPHSNLWSKINRKDLVNTPIFKLVSWNITSPDKKNFQRLFSSRILRLGKYNRTYSR